MTGRVDTRTAGRPFARHMDSAQVDPRLGTGEVRGRRSCRRPGAQGCRCAGTNRVPILLFGRSDDPLRMRSPRLPEGKRSGGRLTQAGSARPAAKQSAVRSEQVREANRTRPRERRRPGDVPAGASRRARAAPGSGLSQLLQASLLRPARRAAPSVAARRARRRRNGRSESPALSPATRARRARWHPPSGWMRPSSTCPSAAAAGTPSRAPRSRWASLSPTRNGSCPRPVRSSSSTAARASPARTAGGRGWPSCRWASRRAPSARAWKPTSPPWPVSSASHGARCAVWWRSCSGCRSPQAPSTRRSCG